MKPFRRFSWRGGLCAAVALACLHCGGQGSGTSPAGSAGAIATAADAESLLQAGLTVASENIVSQSTSELEALGQGDVAGLALDGTNFKSTEDCPGGGTFSLLLSLSPVERSVVGAIYHLQGLAYFSDCGPSRLNGVLKLSLEIGPIPAFCLAKPCPGGLPIAFHLAPDEKGILLIDGNLVELIGAAFQGRSHSGIADGTYESGEAAVGPWFCTIRPEGVTCSRPAADADGDGIPDDADNCPAVLNSHQTDDDGEGSVVVCDNCLGVANTDQANADGDVGGDACDPCPDLKDSLDCVPPNPEDVCLPPVPPPDATPCASDSDCPTPPEGQGSEFCGLNGFCVGSQLSCDLGAFCTDDGLTSQCPSQPSSDSICFSGRCCYQPQGPAALSASGGRETAAPAPEPPPESVCTVDADCPAGETCQIPEGASSGKCGGTSGACGNCLLEKGEACEPHATPGGPGACPDGTVCQDCAGCVPREEPPPEDPCAAFSSISCDAQTGVIRTDGLPGEISAALGPSPTCGDVYLGECAPTEGGFSCCAPGACGTLDEQLNNAPACGLLALVLNAQNPQDPQTGDQYCDQVFSGVCDESGCCLPPSGPNFCDSCTATPGCIAAPNTAMVCADEACPSVGPPFGINCSVAGQAECDGIADVIGATVCTDGCCVPPPPPPPPI